MIRWVARAVLVTALAGTGLAVAPPSAAEGTTEDLLECANEPDDARRLRCFDDAVAGLRKAVPTAAAASRPEPATPAAAAPAAAAPASPAISAEDRFGARGELKPDHRLSEITATVTALGAKPHGQLVITLDNGQVWAEIATGSKVKLKTGDSVTIEAGALGSFRLIAPNGRSSKVSRVR